MKKVVKIIMAISAVIGSVWALSIIAQKQIDDALGKGKPFEIKEV